MAIPQSTLINNTETWDPNKRYLVNSTVKLNNIVYQNVTGGNGSPLNSFDWVSITSETPKLEYMSQITSSLSLDNTYIGLNNVYPVNSNSDIQITVPNGVYNENDVVNFERRGVGSVEVVAGAGARVRGIRDVNNRYFINDRNSLVSLICRGDNEFSLVGNLTKGYSGAVEITSHDDIRQGETGVDITFIGTGFSANMLDPVLGANASFNSWTFVNPNQITINLDVLGIENDTFDITFDNGDVSVYTATIVTFVPSYDTNDLRHYYPLATNSNDAVVSSPINGTDTDIIYSSDYAEFNGSTSFISFGDDSSFSFGNGTTDTDMSISFLVYFDDVSVPRHIVSKYDASNLLIQEYRYSITGFPKQLFQAKDPSSNGNADADLTPVNLNPLTWYHFALTKTGTTMKIYINGVDQGALNSGTSYTAMEDTTASFILGDLENSGSGKLDGRIRRVGLWEVALTQQQVTDVYTQEVVNNNDLL